MPSWTRPLGKCTITLLRAPLLKDYRDGSYWRDWALAVPTVVTDCMVEPFLLSKRLNVEDFRDREYNNSVVRVFVDPDTDVLATDQFLFNGIQYMILSHPSPWSDLEGMPNHISFMGIRRTG